ncbi:hypothetical protein FI667_g8483, partial [Globisporangium splendens]
MRWCDSSDRLERVDGQMADLGKNDACSQNHELPDVERMLRERDDRGDGPSNAKARGHDQVFQVVRGRDRLGQRMVAFLEHAWEPRFYFLEQEMADFSGRNHEPERRDLVAVLVCERVVNEVRHLHHRRDQVHEPKHVESDREQRLEHVLAGHDAPHDGHTRPHKHDVQGVEELRVVHEIVRVREKSVETRHREARLVHNDHESVARRRREARAERARERGQRRAAQHYAPPDRRFLHVHDRALTRPHDGHHTTSHNDAHTPHREPIPSTEKLGRERRDRARAGVYLVEHDGVVLVATEVLVLVRERDQQPPADPEVPPAQLQTAKRDDRLAKIQYRVRAGRLQQHDHERRRQQQRRQRARVARHARQEQRPLPPHARLRLAGRGVSAPQHVREFGACASGSWQLTLMGGVQLSF